MNTVAFINKENVVTRVIVIPEEQIFRFEDFINELGYPKTENQKFVLCHPQAYRNKYRDGSPGPAFRKNYPLKGYIYDPVSDAFLEPKPTQYPSWVLDTDGGYWKPPVARPNTAPESGKKYIWDENTISWIQVPR
jgi:hypothetical protein